MSGESNERDVEALTEVIRSCRMTPYDDGEGGTLWRQTSATELARAVLRAMAAVIKRDHGVPFGVNRNRSWAYRNGYHDGALNAAQVIDNAADELRGDGA